MCMLHTKLIVHGGTKRVVTLKTQNLISEIIVHGVFSLFDTSVINLGYFSSSLVCGLTPTFPDISA